MVQFFLKYFAKVYVKIYPMIVTSIWTKTSSRFLPEHFKLNPSLNGEMEKCYVIKF